MTAKHQYNITPFPFFVSELNFTLALTGFPPMLSPLFNAVKPSYAV